MTPDHLILVLTGACGAAIGIGKLLLSGTPITTRLFLGNALVTSGMAVGGLALLAVIPGLSVPAQVGIACAMASLGNVGLEKLLDRIFLRKDTPPQ